jgi:hypothetical protein
MNDKAAAEAARIENEDGDLRIEYTGFYDIAYNPTTLAWVSPARTSDDYPRLAIWSVDGYRDDETGLVVGEES